MTNLILKLIKILIAVSFLLMQQLGIAQYNIPEKPDFQTSLYDYANLLNPTEKKNLEEKLVRYSDSTSTQIVVITIEDLKGEDIGILTPKWAHEWGIGQAKEDNGVLILLSKNDRKIWISPGYGVEDRLTAGITGELVRNVIIPEFKAGSYYNGLNKGTDAIFQVLKGKYKGTRKTDNDDLDAGKIFFFIFIFIILMIILSKNKRGGGNGGRFSGPDLGDIIILSRMGRGGGFSGGFGGGSSGGGFGGGGFGGGFGGGGFSGGGAGGSW